MKFSRQKIREMSKRYGGLRSVARLAGVDYDNLRWYMYTVAGNAPGRAVYFTDCLLTETVTALRSQYEKMQMTLEEPP